MQYKYRNVVFSSVAVFRPENQQLPIVYAACSDRSIREISMLENSFGKTSVRQYEDSLYSQIVMGSQRRNIFAGTANDHSGSI